jgi:hypothetical protein
MTSPSVIARSVSLASLTSALPRATSPAIAPPPAANPTTRGPPPREAPVALAAVAPSVGYHCFMEQLASIAIPSSLIRVREIGDFFVEECHLGGTAFLRLLDLGEDFRASARLDFSLLKPPLRIGQGKPPPRCLPYLRIRDIRSKPSSHPNPTMASAEPLEF